MKIFFAWISRNHRLWKDPEATLDSAKAFLYAAAVMILVRRLARISKDIGWTLGRLDRPQPFADRRRGNSDHRQHACADDQAGDRDEHRSAETGWRFSDEDLLPSISPPSDHIDDKSSACPNAHGGEDDIPRWFFRLGYAAGYAGSGRERRAARKMQTKPALYAYAHNKQSSRLQYALTQAHAVAICRRREAEFETSPMTGRIAFFAVATSLMAAGAAQAQSVPNVQGQIASNFFTSSHSVSRRDVPVTGSDTAPVRRSIKRSAR